MGEWIKKTNVGESHVSTVRLTVHHPKCLLARLPGPYETMIFGGKNDEFSIQHQTKEEAINFHNKIIICIRSGLDCENLDYNV